MIRLFSSLNLTTQIIDLVMLILESQRFTVMEVIMIKGFTNK